MAEAKEVLTVDQLAELICRRIKSLVRVGDLHPRFLVAWVNTELRSDSERLDYHAGSFVLTRVVCDVCGTTIQHDALGQFCPRCDED